MYVPARSRSGRPGRWGVRQRGEPCAGGAPSAEADGYVYEALAG